MSLTYAAQQSPVSVRKSSTIVVVVLLHVGFFYAFTHGLNKVVNIPTLTETVAILIPQEIPPEPKPPEPVVKPLEKPIENLVQEVPTPVQLEIPPDIQVNAESSNTAAITPDASGEVAPARSFSVTHRVNPMYPPASRRAGESGTVLLDIVVGRDGVPTEINVERSSGFPALDESAVAAVRKWRFTVNSETNYARVRLPVTFKLETVR